MWSSWRVVLTPPQRPHPPLINPLMLGVWWMFNDLLRKHPKISYYASDSDIMTSHGVQGMISYFPSEILYSQISHYLLIKSPTHPLSWVRKHHQTHINSRHPSYLQTDSQHGSWVYILGFVVSNNFYYWCSNQLLEIFYFIQNIPFNLPSSGLAKYGHSAECTVGLTDHQGDGFVQ